MIFYVKMGETLRSKTRFLLSGHKNQTPAETIYSYVVSRDSVQMALAISELNDLYILACDIHDSYLVE